VPAEEASPESFAVLAQAMGDRLGAGVSQTLALSATVGHRQNQVQETLERHERMANLLSTGLSELESIDDYAASARLSELQAQLEISYAITGRLSRLSLVNYL